MNDGKHIPQLGLGTSPLSDEQVAPLVTAAIEAGYRHIDTAYKYHNEKGVGKGMRDSGISREELFVTTKLDGTYQGSDRAIEGLDGCLERLGLDYVDLLLIHWPLPQRDEYVSTWKTFERLLAEGKARSVGVSNFKPAHLERLLSETSTRPAVNQVQLNPQVTRPEQRAYHAAQGIVTVAYSPLGAGSDLLNHPTLTALAKKHGKTPAQVVLRWHMELGVVAIPRSSSHERIAQNLDIFDFTLAHDEIAAISALDDGTQGVDSDITGH
jgi:2,5-diketo-D-gluconate reductase A